MKSLALLAAGAGGAMAARATLHAAIAAKLRKDTATINAGDYKPFLAGYADDAVLRFNEGDHRWAGDHVGKPAIERFLQEFVAAGLQGEIKDVLVAGPPWALRMIVRFDDWAHDPDGTQIYANRTCLVVRSRWGKIVEHEDFYEDTGRILEFEGKLRERGKRPVAAAV